LARDAQLVGLGPLEVGALSVTNGKAKALGETLVVDGKIVLEEYDFDAIVEPTGGPFHRVAAFFADSFLSKDDAWKPTRERMKKTLCLLSDDDFTLFVRHATEVVARIGLDRDSKTAAKGALFYQELLPAESLLYSVVMAEASRAGGDQRKPATDVFRLFTEKYLRSVLQVGGDETVGRGICSVRMAERGRS
jgi:CRISPR-associated protein Cmr4